jgi:protein-arginine kinase activator protein McsA
MSIKFKCTCDGCNTDFDNGVLSGIVCCDCFSKMEEGLKEKIEELENEIEKLKRGWGNFTRAGNNNVNFL